MQARASTLVRYNDTLGSRDEISCCRQTHDSPSGAGLSAVPASTLWSLRDVASYVSTAHSFTRVPLLAWLRAIAATRIAGCPRSRNTALPVACRFAPAL